ncbi:MAG: polymer-forming cytoskeletal protein [Acidobacteriia bacterium]|nr:polymer-forming cytoskeletal protein [Terriglobia bacterium]
MWNKRPDDPAAPPQAPPNRNAAPPAAMPPRAPAPAPPTSRPVASIGASMSIKGEIRAQEELFVDGDVEGVLESHSSLTVGPNGKVRANIKAREVIVFGSVKGNVEVSDKVAIRDHGSVIGDIRTAGISIDDGAYFKGSIDIVRPQPQAVTKPVKSEPPIAAAVGQS